MSIIRVVGQDPSLRNWGLAVGLLNLNTGALTIDHLDVIQPNKLEGKQVRQNSTDVDVARQLYEGAITAGLGAKACFVEVPVGSKSARAMASYGVCVGVLGGLRASGTPFFEVTPTEVKVTSVGKKTATKEEMIAWAMAKHPEAPGPCRRKRRLHGDRGQG
ncbi:hypothetical protein HSBAA_30620 [Vreelandella sulfidaeris]|uniref:Holliday junction resolvase RuvC n=1 Tax=Vreelandella sulfidaeris TaxID=115553 RepID=A0A455U6L6_9GAMM|nr:hypothetical protein HSBAA_30620 [Halomonas sulfidaeris]